MFELLHEFGVTELAQVLRDPLLVFFLYELVVPLLDGRLMLELAILQPAAALEVAL